MQTLSVKECLAYGWKTFRARPWIFVSASAIIFLASMIVNSVSDLVPEGAGMEMTALGIVAFVVSMAFSFLINMGKTAFYLRAHDEESTVELSDLWHPRPYWKFVGTSVLGGLATLIGLILLIVPGIIIGIMVCFSLYLVVDTQLGPIEALKRSAELTKGNRWQLFGLGLALLGINILGFIALLVGLLVTLPVSTLAIVHAYRTLRAVPAIIPVEEEVGA